MSYQGHSGLNALSSRCVMLRVMVDSEFLSRHIRSVECCCPWKAFASALYDSSRSCQNPGFFSQHLIRMAKLNSRVNSFAGHVLNNV